MLVIENLLVAYGPIPVLTGVSLHACAGCITALIGANGAGKTTTLNAISGLVRPAAGAIRFDGAEIGGLAPEQVVRRGVVHVPEGRRVFRNLTVHECLLVGGYTRPDKTEVAASIAAMYDQFPRLAERRRQLAGTLSGGEQQMLAFARALVARPRLLLLDEPSMGLSPKIAGELAELIVGIKDQGITVLLVEQNAMLALQIADTGYVLEGGRIAQTAPARDLLSDDKVRQAYLGV
jgi:branched-chain amino acid transport system ATP-binding protein